MKFVYENRDEALARGKAARVSMKAHFSQEAVGEQVIDRIRVVAELAVARRAQKEKKAAEEAKRKKDAEDKAKEIKEKIENRVKKIKINDIGDGKTPPKPPGSPPSPPGWGNSWNTGYQQPAYSYSWRRTPPPPPTLKRPPAAVSGQYPGLVDTCVGKEQGEYRYEVCIFKNVTQTSTRWNTVWVMGVFQEWLTNPPNTMSFTEGDTCSGKDRSSNVKVTCSQAASKATLSEISEPKTCEYSMEVTIPQKDCDASKPGVSGGPGQGPAGSYRSSGGVAAYRSTAVPYASAALGVT